MAPITQLMLTTTPGLEDVTAAELGEQLLAAGLDPDTLDWPAAGVAGRVRAAVPLPEAETRRLALGLRLIHHALRHVATFDLPGAGGLAEIERRIRACAWPELDAATPFRVTGSRHGEHGFTSPMLQATAGAVLQEMSGAPVDLEGYAVNVQVDVVRARCIIGVRWTDRPLGLRFERRFNRRVALKPPVAHALLRLATGGGQPARLLDPFCGTGTILLEAGAMLPGTTLFGGDASATCVDGTRANLTAAGLCPARVTRVNARTLARHYPEAYFDVIVTNPPFGRRLGRGTNFTRLYADLLTGAARVLRPGGRLALLAGRRGALDKARRRVGGWRARHARVIDMNHVHAGLVVLERR
ncbi:MAG: methyltransferase [Halofilum sp. (in: g-proteobacteria)]|nr:methyltransferase [Halofilum sp. (in: g-proteobacteria)]